MSGNPKDLIGTKKPPLGLVPTAGIIHEAMAMKDGAAKYGPYNWRENGKAVKYSVYHNAALRHIYAAFDGEECASDSGADHLGHARACLGIILDARECGMLIDDRPKPGSTAKLLAKLTEKEPVETLTLHHDIGNPCFGGPECACQGKKDGGKGWHSSGK
jgi:hypothetical protein